jgi:hypothetical protein
MEGERSWSSSLVSRITEEIASRGRAGIKRERLTDKGGAVMTIFPVKLVKADGVVAGYRLKSKVF